MRQWWQNRSIRTQIQVLTMLGIVGLIAMMVTAIVQMNQALQTDIAAKIHAEVDGAYSILEHYGAEEQAGHLTRDQAQQAAKETLRAMRYDGKNYFFMIDLSPRMILLPFKPEMEGKDLSHVKDPTGFSHYAAIVALVKRQSEGQIGYHWPKPGTDTVMPKLSYVKGFARWGWIVGTGAYLDDTHALEWIYAWKLIGLCTLIAVAVVAAGVALRRGITNPVRDVTARMRGLAEGDATSPVPFTDLKNELGAMGRAVLVFRDGLLEKQRLEGEARARAAADAARAAENARIRSALDRVAVGVTLTDLTGTVIYANEACTQLLTRRSAEIRRHSMAFDPTRIVGQPLDWLPAEQRPALTSGGSSHPIDLKFGPATLRITANTVIDADGERLGTVLQWIDRSDEVATEAELEATVASAVEGDLTARVRLEGKDGFFKSMANGMNRLIASMGDVLRGISTAAVEVGSGAEEISRGNADLSQRTEQQATSLAETAASMNQMTSTVKNNADNASQANQLARAARDQAEQGSAVLESAVGAMAQIQGSSKKIADIITVIDAIAFQTNLLALNAAVESARAGEHGRGFAVVASEVRNLASRSAAAAKEIKVLIDDSVAKVGDGSRLVEASGQVFQSIVAGVKKVTDVVAEIAASSQDQASGIEQVNKAVASMDDATQQNAALVEQATAAAHSLGEQAGNLTQLIARYRIAEGSGSNHRGRVAAEELRRRSA